jgi:FkbM family methyltransferase
MSFVHLVKFIWTHPLNRDAKLQALGRFVRWQLAARLIKNPVALPFVEGTRLITEKGMTGATGNWYCGLHEQNEMGFVLHAVRPGELFMDIGANVGSYTILAAGAIGARVITVEPLPTTFNRLGANIRYNDLAGRIEAHCCGLSSETGEIRFTADLDTMNRVAQPHEAIATKTVPVTTTDLLLGGQIPTVIKIDVEGHEAAVLAGGSATLSDPGVQAVLMETNGCGIKFGVSDDQLIATMTGHGFSPCAYNALSRTLVPAEKGEMNTIFVRDVEAVQAKCRAAPRYTLINGSI